jgi:hypothetical protein
MRKAAGGFGLAEKTLAIFLFFFWWLSGQVDGFHGDHAVDLRVARFVDDTHGPPPQFGEDFVAPETFDPAFVHASA